MPNQHLDELLFDLAVGAVGPAELPSAERHLAECEQCRLELVATTEILAAVACAEPPQEPPPELRRRVLSSIGASRFAAVLDKFAALFDLTRGPAEALLATLDDAETWMEGPLPGFHIAHAQAGPSRAGAYTGFVRLAPGLHFPAHRHLGDESMLVLAGGFRVNDGRLFHEGDRLGSEAGSVHDFVVLDDGECIAAVVQHVGIEFGVALAR